MKAVNRNIFVFAFFLLLSFIFWYLNSLGKDIETELKYPVVFTELPRGQVLASPLPDRLLLKVKGPGYLIMKQMFTGSRSPLEVDFSKNAEKTRGKTSDENYLILTSGLLQTFNAQFGPDCRILSISPDTLLAVFR
jgi:hypothetical protein